MEISSIMNNLSYPITKFLILLFNEFKLFI